MQPEEREIIKKTLELAEENNRMLHSIKRGMMWGRVVKILYWTAILAVSIGLYYYIEPYLDGAIDIYGSLKTDLKQFGNLLN